MGPEDEVHPFHLENFIALELGVAAGDGYDGIGVDALEASDYVPAFLVGVLGDGAGVDDIDAGTFRRRYYGITTGYKFPLES